MKEIREIAEYRKDPLTRKIIACIIKVHTVLGPGFLEKIYRNALLVELRRSGMRAEIEKEFKVYYEGELVGRHRVDIIVVGTVVIEVKTVEDFGRTHYAQLRSCLRAAGLRTGLLANFAKASAEYRRVEIPSPQSP